LSGGQKKLFAITRCLLRNPTILLLDEPTTGIDPSEKFELVSMMRQACAGRTVMVVDHDIVGWQVLFCDHIFVLNEGRLEQQGTPGELLSRGGLFKELFDDQAEGFHKMTEAIRAADAKRLPRKDMIAAVEASMQESNRQAS
jgi:ABC-type multidrug transport system fused ATPase/permease subunit